MVDELDKGPEDIQEPVEEQTEQVQADAVTDETSTDTVESGIQVGNQTFKSAEELRAAYAELMKGKTQSDQRAAKEREAIRSLMERIGRLKSDPTKWRQFTALLQGQAEAAEESREPDQRQVQRDPEVSRLRDEVETMRADAEYGSFISAHPDLAKEERNEIVNYVISQDIEGNKVSLENAYKLIMFDRHSAKLVTKGEKNVQDSLKKGKDASSLAPGATASQSMKTKTKGFFDLKSEKAMRAKIEEKMRELGVDFEE